MPDSLPFAPYSPLGGVSLAEVALPSPRGPSGCRELGLYLLLSSQLPQQSQGPHGPAPGTSPCAVHWTVQVMSRGTQEAQPGGWVEMTQDGLGPLCPAGPSSSRSKPLVVLQQTDPGLIPLRSVLAFVQIQLLRPD